MRYFWWRVTRPFVWVWRWIQIGCSWRYTATHSGNRCRRRGFLRAAGEKRFCTLPLVNGTIPYTHRDIEQMTILCAWCAQPIFVGDLVTLYSPGEPDYLAPEGTVIYSLSPLRMIGCTRCDCVDTGADYAGQWVPDDEKVGKGRVGLMPSPYLALGGPGQRLRTLGAANDERTLTPVADE